MVINTKKRINPLKNKIFIFFLIFSLSILVLLWLFQVIFINSYYETFKTNELEHALNTVKNNYTNDNFYDILETLSYDSGICSEITINGITTYSTNLSSRGCVNTNDVKGTIYVEKKNFLAGSKDTLRLRVINTRLNNKTLVFGYKINKTTTVFMNTSIDPIDSTVLVLKNQLIVITIILIIMSIAIAYIISNKLSKPITKLTTKSKELSNGNFDVDFRVDTDIVELNELADSLNYAKDVLKQNEELRRDLMANVSHDLKTPLTMIQAYAEMVRDLTYKDEEKRTSNLNIIIEEVNRLNILVNDILNLSKLESNIEVLNKEEFDLTELINTIINRFKIFAMTEDYHFVFNYNKPLIIKADKQKIEQVIYNLIGNAVNYTGSDKYIYINIFDTSVIRVEITDTGKGIIKDEINMIWDKYYKSDKNHRRNTVGTGLGLSIVKHIFKLHNYKYGVISDKNQGSTFYFEIKKD